MTENYKNVCRCSWSLRIQAKVFVVFYLLFTEHIYLAKEDNMNKNFLTLVKYIYVDHVIQLFSMKRKYLINQKRCIYFFGNNMFRDDTLKMK